MDQTDYHLLFDYRLQMKDYQIFPMEILKVVHDDNEEITAAVEDGKNSLMENKVKKCWEGYWWAVKLAREMLKTITGPLALMKLVLAF